MASGQLPQRACGATPARQGDGGGSEPRVERGACLPSAQRGHSKCEAARVARDRGELSP